MPLEEIFWQGVETLFGIENIFFKLKLILNFFFKFKNSKNIFKSLKKIPSLAHNTLTKIDKSTLQHTSISSLFTQVPSGRRAYYQEIIFIISSLSLHAQRLCINTLIMVYQNEITFLLLLRVCIK